MKKGLDVKLPEKLKAELTRASYEMSVEEARRVSQAEIVRRALERFLGARRRRLDKKESKKRGMIR